MFNFLMKPQLLPLSKTANVQHFYQFQAKQIHQKQTQQINKLKELKTKIQTEQTKLKQTKQPKYQTIKEIPSKNSNQQDFSKSYMLDSSLKSQQKSKPNSTKSFNEFYQKNKKWKENLQAQIIKKKQQKIQQQQKQLSECRKPLSQKQLIQNNPSKQNQTLTHAFDSKGPISGWTQRFHSYIKKRLPQELQDDFKPKINRKSQIIASRMVGKVQDRLIKFGEIMKMRKHQMVIEELQKIGKLPNSEAHFASTNSNKSEFFHRLYKEGEKTNRKTKEKFQQAIKNEFSYKPKITKLDDKMEKKVKQKRQKSPLYTTKKMSKQKTQRLMEMFQKQTGRVMKESDFENFMRRNELLLQKKDRNLEKKLREEVIKAQNELKECTFIPILNKKSMRMLSKIENEEIRETQQEHFQDFGYGQSSQRLFDNLQKDNGNKKCVSKYSYNHSYTEGHEFEYSINTPTTEKWEAQNQFHLRTQTKSKANQMSQLDSLEFSGQNKSQNKFVNKDNFSIDNLSYNKQDEIINYELTFSNKKLTKQLNSFNEEISGNQQDIGSHQGENHQHQQDIPSDQQDLTRFKQDSAQHKQNMTQERQERFKYRSDKIQEQSLYHDQQIKDKTINDWQTQLQKVKNRLQNLMKSNKKHK